MEGSGEGRRRGDEPAAGPAGLLREALQRAWWSLAWERVWPPLVGLATVVGLFLTVSWAGLWLVLPGIGRAIGLVLFGLLLLAAGYPLARLTFPTLVDGLRRLDRGSGLPHRPATAIADRMASKPDDPVSAALWRAHVERAATAAKTLRAGLPAPRLAARDPLALRALVLLLVVTSFIGAGSERGRRIAAAFDWSGVVTPANYRIDAWVTPPAYTGRPPVILPGMRPGEPIQQASAPIAVPAGSQLVVRASGAPDLELQTIGGLAPASDESTSPAPAGSEERRFTIAERGSVTVRGPGGNVTWAFTAIPDKPPVIALTKDPEPQVRGSLQLSYKVEDDYGVVAAEATFVRKEEPAPIVPRADAKPPRPLYEAPKITLALPHARAKSGTAQTLKDLTEHPWAGADVTMTLVARDEAKNEGRSEAHAFRLPQRPFHKPLARALIEQRRTLALDAERRGTVARALDALAIAPEKFTPEVGVYLGLRSVYWQLVQADNDEDLRGVVDRLWQMATMIEDGNVSDAEQQLRAAQEALREALERGASDEELKKLMDDLRAALDKFMQALAEEMRKNPQQLARPLDPNAQVMRPQDLKNMLDRMERLARSGAKDAAKRMLDELQQMLENLQTARPGQQQDGGDGDMMSKLDELGNMIRRQQQLRDRTFREGQQGQQGQRGQRNQRGQRGQQGDQLGALQQDQQRLRQQLEKLLEELRQRGLGQNQPGQPGEGQEGQQGQQGAGEMDALGEAGEAMGDAEGQLGEGNADGAVDSQGRALENLRRGAQGLAQQLQQQDGGPGPDGQPGRTGPASRAQQETDPLGRPLRGRDYGDDVTVKVPGEIDVQRARRILEELRRRFSDPQRPQLELDYLERLLKDF